MQISLLRAKIHRAEITDANLFYEGSLTLDEDLMDAAGVVEYEKVHVVNVNNGARLETYLIKGKRGSREVCLNGAAARLGHRGDKVIVIAYAQMTPEEAKTFQPKIVLLGEGNNIQKVLPVS
ncbi:MAG: aspartate 1-decarboxylase [Leptospiraceae bacterium]|nr:aspartate 1-decarboxylase [Leptospiraceae bacterium]